MPARIVSFHYTTLHEKTLSPADRKLVPKSKEAFPSKHGKEGAYPIPDKAHAKAAKGFCAMHNGADSSTCQKVNTKANKVLGNG